VFIIGDFNAKIGLPTSEDSTVMGPWGYGVRNGRGATLIDFCMENELYIMNTHFQKKPKLRWTWKSPNEMTRNEINKITSKTYKILKL
jgi:hypothetical protein